MKTKNLIKGLQKTIDKQIDLIDELSYKIAEQGDRINTLEEGVRVLLEREKNREKPSPYFVDPIFKEYMEGEDATKKAPTTSEEA